MAAIDLAEQRLLLQVSNDQDGEVASSACSLRRDPMSPFQEEACMIRVLGS